MTNVVAKIVNSNGEESIKMVRIMGSTKLYGISRNKGVKAPYTLFFEQGVLPCLTNEGKIMLETKSKVCPHCNKLDSVRSRLLRTAMEASIEPLSRRVCPIGGKPEFCVLRYRFEREE